MRVLAQALERAQLMVRLCGDDQDGQMAFRFDFLPVQYLETAPSSGILISTPFSVLITVNRVPATTLQHIRLAIAFPTKRIFTHGLQSMPIARFPKYRKLSSFGPHSRTAGLRAYS